MAAKHFMIAVVLLQSIAHGHVVKRSFTLKPVLTNTADKYCLYCQGAVVPRDCNTVTTCGQHEKCYVDSYVTSIGSIRYDLGCRDSLQCNSPGVLGKRNAASTKNKLSYLETDKRATGRLICSECCTGEICNNAGCGNTGYPAQRGPICYNCQEQNGTSDCNKITICGRDEVCMLLATQNSVSHAHRYQTKCEGKQRCEDEIRRRQVSVVSALTGRKRDSLYVGNSCDVECCTKDLCNSKCISQPVNPCFPNPCIKGTCISNKASFLCRCNDKFSGPTCNQATSLCEGFGITVKFKTLDSYFTHDSRYYHMFNFGEFTMYESTARQFQIQIRTQPADVLNRPTYNVICAAAVRENNDVIVIDMCQRNHSNTSSMTLAFPSGKLSVGTVVTRGASYMSPQINMTFPSGAFVFVTAIKQTFLRIYVHSAKEDFNATQGLCGTFDDNTDNDLTRPNHQVDNFQHVSTQEAFAESWRIPVGQSMFDKYGIGKRQTKDQDNFGLYIKIT